MSETHLGKYRLLGLLATGGMGEVFLARQEGPAGFAKPAVVKRVLAHLIREPGFVEMFLDEARLAALLTHPNVIQIFELGEDAGTYFIAMEYLHGKSLRSIRQVAAHQKIKIEPGFVAAVISQALLGLHYAHGITDENGKPLNLVHRDVSPDNVMVGFNGQVKVLDFGIAKANTAITTTRTGTVKGKFAYMAPEQLLAEPLDGRADIYAVGVLMYELLAGVRPFVAPTDAALVNVVLNTPPPPLKEKAPEVPEELAEIVMKSISKDRTLRWSSAEDLSLALETWVRSAPHDWTHATTRARYLTSLYGPDVPDHPVLITPSGAHPAPRPSRPSLGSSPLPSPSPSFDVDLAATKTGTPSAVLAGLTPPPPRQGLPRFWWLALLAIPLAVVATALVMRPSVSQPLTVEPLPPEVKTEPPAAPDASATVVAAPPNDAADAGTTAAVVRVQVPDAGRTVASARGRGKIDFRINPWGEVFEGGKSLGITPMAPVELPAGPHSFTITNSELKVKTTRAFTVVPGKTAVLRVELME